MRIEDVEKIFKNREPGVIGGYRRFSVLVPLVEKDGELNLLFELRSPDLDNQPGEVCFPGGGIEQGETAEACALRETTEELGIDGRHIRMISQLDSLHTYSNSSLYSFLAEINYDGHLEAKINTDEVESVFFVPLSWFANSEPLIYEVVIRPEVGEDFPYQMVGASNGYNWKKGNYRVPIYRYGDKAIWGLTARIVYNLLEVILGKD